jgi:hypothetical protein
VVEPTTLQTNLEAPGHGRPGGEIRNTSGSSGEGRVQRKYVVRVALIVLGSLALLSPALRGTLLADDWDHYAMQQRIYPVAVPAWDMFRFVSDSAVERNALLDSGRLPWWSSSDLQLAVFRPLSSLLVYADLAWLNGSQHPWWMHLHSLLWWGVLLTGVAALYRRFLPLPVAIMGLLVFAVDDAHVYPVVWIANRSEVVSIALVCWGIWAHVTADDSAESWKSRAASWLLVALGLLAGEHAIAPLCYLVAFELVRARPRWTRLVPHLGLMLGYLTWRSAWGYGVAGSAFYVDPIGEPLRYLDTSAVRIPLLAGDLVLGIAAEWWFWGVPYINYVKDLVPRAWLDFSLLQTIQHGLGVVCVLACSSALLWGFRASSSSQRLRTLWALLLAAAVSLIPLAGTASMTRLTVVPAIAFDAFLGYLLLWLYTCFRGATTRRLRIFSGTLGVLVAAQQLVRPAAYCVQGAQYLTNSSHLEYGWTTQADFGDADVTKRSVFIVSAHDMAAQYLMPYLLHAARLPAPQTAHLLSAAAANSHVLTRVAPNVLDIQFPEPITNRPFAPMVYRQGGSAFYPGQRFHNALFDVEVLLVRGVEPRHLRFTFQKALDDPSYLFMYPTEDGIEPLQLPELGASIRLPSPAWPQ